jgi:hypothetical protein
MYFDSSVEACPISEEQLGHIYRTGPDGVESAVSNLPHTARARLAAFCYARTHLHEIGLAIAATCDERSLTEAAGRAGEALYARSRKRVAVIQGGLAEPEDDANPVDLPAVQCSAIADPTPAEDFEDASALAVPGSP